MLANHLATSSFKLLYLMDEVRMLEVDNGVIVPELTHIRFIVTGADIIHSFACPALGIKCDAYPGRLNRVSVLLNREGVFYGQCSEICGILHRKYI